MEQVHKIWNANKINQFVRYFEVCGTHSLMAPTPQQDTELVAYKAAPVDEIAATLGDDTATPSPAKTDVNDADDEDHGIIHRTSKKVTGVYARNICLSYWVATGMLLVITFISSTVWGATEPGEYDWIVSTSKYSKDQDAVQSAFKLVDPLSGDSDLGPRTTKSYIHSIFYIYGEFPP